MKTNFTGWTAIIGTKKSISKVKLFFLEKKKEVFDRVEFYFL